MFTYNTTRLATLSPTITWVSSSSFSISTETIALGNTTHLVENFAAGESYTLSNFQENGSFTSSSSYSLHSPGVTITKSFSSERIYSANNTFGGGTNNWTYSQKTAVAGGDDITFSEADGNEDGGPLTPLNTAYFVSTTTTAVRVINYTANNSVSTVLYTSADIGDGQKTWTTLSSTTTQRNTVHYLGGQNTTEETYTTKTATLVLAPSDSPVEIGTIFEPAGHNEWLWLATNEATPADFSVTTPAFVSDVAAAVSVSTVVWPVAVAVPMDWVGVDGTALTSPFTARAGNTVTYTQTLIAGDIEEAFYTTTIGGLLPRNEGGTTWNSEYTTTNTLEFITNGGTFGAHAAATSIDGITAIHTMTFKQLSRKDPYNAATAAGLTTYGIYQTLSKLQPNGNVYVSAHVDGAASSAMDKNGTTTSYIRPELVVLEYAPDDANTVFPFRSAAMPMPFQGAFKDPEAINNAASTATNLSANASIYYDDVSSVQIGVVTPVIRRGVFTASNLEEMGGGEVYRYEWNPNGEELSYSSTDTNGVTGAGVATFTLVGTPEDFFSTASQTTRFGGYGPYISSAESVSRSPEGWKRTTYSLNGDTTSARSVETTHRTFTAGSNEFVIGTTLPTVVPRVSYGAQPGYATFKRQYGLFDSPFW